MLPDPPISLALQGMSGGFSVISYCPVLSGFRPFSGVCWKICWKNFRAVPADRRNHAIDFAHQHGYNILIEIAFQAEESPIPNVSDKMSLTLMVPRFPVKIYVLFRKSLFTFGLMSPDSIDFAIREMKQQNMIK